MTKVPQLQLFSLAQPAKGLLNASGWQEVAAADTLIDYIITSGFNDDTAAVAVILCLHGFTACSEIIFVIFVVVASA